MSFKFCQIAVFFFVTVIFCNIKVLIIDLLHRFAMPTQD